MVLNTCLEGKNTDFVYVEFNVYTYLAVIVSYWLLDVLCVHPRTPIE